MGNGPLFATGTFIWGLAALCQLHRRPFAPDLLLQQFPPPYSVNSFEDAAKTLEFKTGSCKVVTGELQALPQPFLAILGPEPGADEKDPAERNPSPLNRLTVVLRCDNENVLFITEKSATPSTVGLRDFDTQYVGLVVLCTPEAVAANQIDVVATREQRIAIARALLKGATILIFDEATSNLDQETAEQFARTVNQLKGRVTMMFIAHQLPRGLRLDGTIGIGTANDVLGVSTP